MLKLYKKVNHSFSIVRDKDKKTGIVHKGVVLKRQFKRSEIWIFD